MDNRIVVTLRKSVQIGPEDWEMKPVSRVFNIANSIEHMLEWAKSTGIKDANIGDLNFSEYCED